ncbi:fibroblast growth factor receptor substrate 2 [Neodiprion fabricii]|uniref:fibroblast growth factor receptor substrate 2 n=1 Tax=Neodiprion fabricii TaxID=2872261 RepID=UPI001ED9418D|nr:fibroblast growth factor receptor substrate 2 [Neodiprion fabricii]XP_046418383.1 fibroblast growth factor receptor substrate 2 [Neodiprion fabricii]
MGCVNSRADINDLHPNIFQVMNVDDAGNLITPGKLEITDLDIVLYQRDKQPVKWPLRCLRRYGYDAEIFSFESGRRCSTGPGIYAFKCRRAEQLFNLVQTNIQVCNSSGDDTISRELPVASHPGSTVTMRVMMPSEPSYLDPTPARSNSRIGPRFSHSQQNGIGRLGSVGSSSGPMSPQGTMGSPSPPPMLPPPPPVPHPPPSSLYVNEEVLTSATIEREHNNNKSLRRTMQRSCTVSSTTSSSGFMALEPTPLPLPTSQESSCRSRPPPLPMASYINVDLSSDASPLSPSHSISDSTPLREEASELDGAQHAYMNISPGQEHYDTATTTMRTSLPQVQPDWEDEPRHCYANLESSDIEGLRKRFSGISTAEKSPLLPTTPPAGPVREVNYAVLDLDQKHNTTAVSPEGNVNPANTPIPPDSPNKPLKGYATIDFNKTTALSHSVNPNLVNDNEGSRKTRHNSTINDLSAPSRHSSSISE